MRIDNSIKDEYWTQLNNKRFPYSACNVTSGIMFMRSNRIPYTNPTTEADDDYMMWRMRQPDAYQKMEELTPWAVRDRDHEVRNWDDPVDVGKRYRYPPSEVWECLAWGINQLVGRVVCRTNFKLSLQEFLFEFAQGRVLICGGKFVPSGHFVCGVGMITGQEDILTVPHPTGIDAAAVSHIIVDDPYGNYSTGYRDHRGNSVEIPRERFLDVAAAYRHSAYGAPKKILYGIVKIAA